MSYTAKAIAFSTYTDQNGNVVTSSSSATAESNISYADAYNIAYQIALEVAQSVASNDSNIINSTLNIISNGLFGAYPVNNGSITSTDISNIPINYTVPGSTISGYIDTTTYGSGYTNFTLTQENIGTLPVLNIVSDCDPLPMYAGVTYFTNTLPRIGFGGGNTINSSNWYYTSIPYYGGISLNNLPPPVSNTSTTLYPLGAVGIVANGIPIFIASAGSDLPPDPNTTGGTVTKGPDGFFFDPIVFATRYGVDQAGGHPSSPPINQYHYHDQSFLYQIDSNGNIITNTAWQTSKINNQLVYNLSPYFQNGSYNGDYYRHPYGHSKILGFSLDGFPMYGPFGYSDPLNSSSKIIIMKSSYQLRNPNAPLYSTYSSNGYVVGEDPPSSGTINQRVPFSATGPGYTTSTDGITTNSSGYVVAIINGGFVQDYQYINGLGLLDEYNGRYCVTPDYPNGTYAYFMTFTYPYMVGKRTRNTLFNLPATKKTNKYATVSNGILTQL